MDTFGKLWKKTEITSKNQNDAEKKRKLPLEEITEYPLRKSKRNQHSNLKKSKVADW